VNPYWLFITPLTLVALYLQAFMRPRVIVPVYIISLLPLLVYADKGIALFIIFLVGGMVSIAAFPVLGKGWKQFLLALLAFVSMALTYLALRLVGAMSGVVLQDLLRLLVASFLAVAGYPLIYLFEKLFNLVSNSRLSELADTSSKLLRELEQKAPGTFQHSLQVMNMADAVALQLALERAIIDSVYSTDSEIWLLVSTGVLVGDAAVDGADQIGTRAFAFSSREAACDHIREFMRPDVNDSRPEGAWDDTETVDDVLDSIFEGNDDLDSDGGGMWAYNGSTRAYEWRLIRLGVRT
jgi:hypothetical protein